MMLSTYDTYNQFQNEVFITDIYNKNYRCNIRIMGAYGIKNNSTGYILLPIGYNCVIY